MKENANAQNTHIQYYLKGILTYFLFIDVFQLLSHICVLLDDHENIVEHYKHYLGKKL